MKQSGLGSGFRFSHIVSLLLIILLVSGPVLSAQSNQPDSQAEDRTESAGIKPAPPVQKYDIGSAILLGTGFASNIASGILWFVAADYKDEYDSALAAYEADASEANTTARDSAATDFWVPAGTAIGLTVLGVILTLIGFSAGNGGKDYIPVDPVALSALPAEPEPSQSEEPAGENTAPEAEGSETAAPESPES